METFYAEYLERLGDLHAGIQREISGLSPQSLDWSPGGEMNSLAVLVVHLTGAERYWIGDVACQDPSDRDRQAEFRTRGLEANALIQRLEDTLAYARQALAQASLADLQTVRTSPRDGKSFTVSWALLHALEHTAIHLGHIQLTRQLSSQVGD